MASNSNAIAFVALQIEERETCKRVSNRAGRSSGKQTLPHHHEDFPAIVDAADCDQPCLRPLGVLYIYIQLIHIVCVYIYIWYSIWKPVSYVSCIYETPDLSCYIYNSWYDFGKCICL